MRLDNIHSVLKDNIAIILGLCKYEDRIKKCIEIINNTHFEEDVFYLKQESDDVVEMLGSFLVEEEAYDYMKDHNYNAFQEAIDIVDICKTSTYENKYWRTIPMHLTCYAKEGYKISILGVQIGNSVEDVRGILDKYGIIYEFKTNNDSCEIENKLASKYGGVEFKLVISFDNGHVNSFSLSSNPSKSNRRWLVLDAVDEFFSECSYRLEKCSADSILQIYSSYYDIAEVYQNNSNSRIRIVSSKQYEREHKPWWKV